MPESPNPIPPARSERCLKHPAKPGTHRCSQCRRLFCSDCVFDWEGEWICRSCVQAFRATPQPLPDEEGESRPEPGWAPVPLFSVRLLLRILLHPVRFFQNLPLGRGLAEPFLFGFVCLTILITLSVPSMYLDLRFLEWAEPKLEERGIQIDFLPAPGAGKAGQKTSEKGPGSAEGTGNSPGADAEPAEGAGGADSPEPGEVSPSQPITLLGMFRMVLPLVADLLFLTLIRSFFHFSIIRFFGYREPFEIVLRIAFFSLAANALGILPIPIVARLASNIYEAILCGIGFKQVYRMPTGRAVTVTLLPFLIMWVIQAIARGLADI